jgi:Flp pilus assembly pilin Flp
VKNLLVKLWREEQGQDLAEYVLLVTLISLAAIAAMQDFANGISDTFLAAATRFTAAT